MKIIFTSVIWLCSVATSVAQYFSGEVEYQVRIVAKVKDLNTDSIMAQQPGTGSVYKITDGFYKSTYYREGRETYSYTYHGNTKLMYDSDAGKDYITFRDSRKANNVRIRSIIYKDSVRVVAGYECFMVERVYENYISKTFYAKDLKINSDSFKDHATGDWYNQIREVNGALSLGSVNEYASHIEVNEVVRVTPAKLTGEDFELPPDKPVVASALALDERVELILPSTETVSCYQEKSTAALKDIAQIKHVCYVGFIVKADGTIIHTEPYEKDDYGLYKVAVEVVEKCGLKFKPGRLDGKAVDSWVYFPVEFSK
ncbi:MAG: energy transducer TonB [Cyclobacteriaceae bacterium]|jgi:hypothetical protein|nr:energy transducer TonB [Cyclobacteriaceae bacterium]